MWGVVYIYAASWPRIRDGPLARGCREHPALHRSPGDESWQLAQHHPPHGRQDEDVEGAGTSSVERGPKGTSEDIPRPGSITTSVTVGAVRARGDGAGWEEGLVQPWDPGPPPPPPTTAQSPLLAPLPDQSQPRCSLPHRRGRPPCGFVPVPLGLPRVPGKLPFTARYGYFRADVQGDFHPVYARIHAPDGDLLRQRYVADDLHLAFGRRPKSHHLPFSLILDGMNGLGNLG